MVTGALLALFAAAATGGPSSPSPSCPKWRTTTKAPVKGLEFDRPYTGGRGPQALIKWGLKLWADKGEIPDALPPLIARTLTEQAEEARSLLTSARTHMRGSLPAYFLDQVERWPRIRPQAMTEIWPTVTETSASGVGHEGLLAIARRGRLQWHLSCWLRPYGEQDPPAYSNEDDEEEIDEGPTPAAYCWATLWEDERALLRFTAHFDDQRPINSTWQIRSACGRVELSQPQGDHHWGEVTPERPLPAPSSTVRAASHLPRYPPSLMADRRSQTAWVEGDDKSAGLGQWIEVSWAQPVAPRDLTIVPGYLKSRALFFANARPKTAIVRFGRAQRTLRFRDFPAVYRFVLQPLSKTRAVHIAFTEVYPGTKYPDMAVSELSVSTSPRR